MVLITIQGNTSFASGRKNYFVIFEIRAFHKYLDPIGQGDFGNINGLDL